jgi:hypothetical protein
VCWEPSQDAVAVEARAAPVTETEAVVEAAVEAAVAAAQDGIRSEEPAPR